MATIYRDEFGNIDFIYNDELDENEERALRDEKRRLDAEFAGLFEDYEAEIPSW